VRRQELADELTAKHKPGPAAEDLVDPVPPADADVPVTAEEQEKAAQAAAGAGGQPDMQSIIQQIINHMGGSAGAMEIPGAGGDRGMQVEQAMRKAMGQPASIMTPKKRNHRDSPKGFLEQAGVGQFSMCFNDGADGVLRIGEEPKHDKKSLGGMGTQHWGVDFRGVTVGHAETKETHKPIFCSAVNMSKDQKSPCGAIPDSGTTVMMGPASHMKTLLEGICDSWPRCKSNYTKLIEAEKKAEDVMKETWGINPFDMKVMNKTDILQLLLMDCDSWMGKEHGLKEMPDLHFHVRGHDGTAQALKIPANAYVMEASGEDAVSTMSLLKGVGNFSSNIPVDEIKKGKKVCMPAFGTMEYNTKDNGPVWILGTPIFYEYVVGYDMNSKPPSMSFESQAKRPCGSCSGGGEINMVATGEVESTVESLTSEFTMRMPRRIEGPPRLPNIDIKQPL